MSEVSFYRLQGQAVETTLPRLLERILEAGLRAVVRTPDDGVTGTLDRALWTFDPAAFLPHGTVKSGQAEHQPVYLTSGDEVPNGAEALVVINDAEMGEPGDFKRCFIMFDGRLDSVVEQARRRWQKLEGAGHEMTYWQQNDQGAWEKGTQP
jgi:DNA polymerase-3 subunit chi